MTLSGWSVNPVGEDLEEDDSATRAKIIPNWRASAPKIFLILSIVSPGLSSAVGRGVHAGRLAIGSGVAAS